MNYNLVGKVTKGISPKTGLWNELWNATISAQLPDGRTEKLESKGFVEKTVAERSMKAQMDYLENRLKDGDFDAILKAPTRVKHES